MGTITAKTLEARQSAHRRKLEAFVATWADDSQGVTHIPLAEGKEALIDTWNRSFVESFYWHLHKSTRIKIKYYAEAHVPKHLQDLFGKTISLHRLCMGFPRGKQIDHRHGNGLDCRVLEMREATGSENASNRHYANKSGFRGVTKHYNKWLAQLDHQGIHYNLGRYDTPEEAAIRYNEEARVRFGDFAILNEVCV